MKQISPAKILHSAFAFCLSTAIATPVFSADDITISTPHRASRNMASSVYFGAHLGSASYDEADDSSAAFGVFGGYQLNEVLAVEVAYNDFGKAEDSGIDEEASAASLAMVATLPFKTESTFFAKVGLSAWDIDISPGSASDSGTDVYFGIGADHDISGTSAVRFGIDWFSMNGDFDENITLFSIGYMYKP